MADVRTRMAPSPTGSPHVGSAYIALFNLAFARRHGGSFVLRIEDTDQERSRDRFETDILDAFRWLGLQWDEGPDVGGPHGPYRQSERLSIYREHIDQLLTAGHAYCCFCSTERLQELRSEQSKLKQKLGYDRRCRALAASDIEPRLAAGEPHVVRLKMPDSGAATVADRLRGEIEFDYAHLDDQVILKSDGYPTYHFAVVVDDHLMGITHVIRGEDWINSAPKHLLLYKYFGWEPPEHTHLPLLLNPDGSRMSKRKNPTSVEYYRRMGYLGPALCNYLGLMSYAQPGEEEKFGIEEFFNSFDLERVSLGGAIFDRKKLDWLNGRYIREDLKVDDLLNEMRKWQLNDGFLRDTLPLMQERMDTLGDYMGKCAFFFMRDLSYEPEELVPKKRTAEEVVQVLQTAIWSLDEIEEWNRTAIENALGGVAHYWQWPIRDVTAPLYVATMGQRVGPPLYESMELLRVDLIRVRLMDGIERLGGLSKKKASQLEKRWQAGRLAADG